MRELPGLQRRRCQSAGRAPSREGGRCAFDLLIVLAIAALGIYQFLLVPEWNREAVERLRTQPLPISAEDGKLLESYRAKPAPDIMPGGKYFAEGEVDGISFEVTYLYGKDGTLMKDAVFLGEYRLRGTASYRFEGSVMVFSDIRGDRALFSEHGEAVSISSIHEVVIHESGETPLVLKSPELLEREATELVANDRRDGLAPTALRDLSSRQDLEQVLVDLDWWEAAVLLVLVSVIVALFISLQRYIERRP